MEKERKQKVAFKPVNQNEIIDKQKKVNLRSSKKISAFHPWKTNSAENTTRNPHLYIH